jgi:hypothetical protein
MCIVLDKSIQLLLGSYGQKKNFWTITQPLFVLEQNFITMTPPKMGKIIGVSEVDFYSEIDF